MTQQHDLQELASPHLKWWGEHTFELHQVKAWQFGSLLFRLTRGINEWRLEYHRPQYQYDYEQNWHSITDTNFACPQPRKIERYMFKKTHETFQLMPRLADRSVVIKPVDPIYIPAGQRGTLYISTPLWIAGFVEGQREPLFDLPVIQPKDTWFGPDRRNGEICYATAVDGRTDINQLKPRAFRAVTPVEFHNTSSQQLRFDRMNVPVAALPLFYSESTQRLWTSQIKVLHEGYDKPPRIRIENRTPPLAGEVIYVHPPRSPGGALFNMFDSFF
ncbi:MULTISPECIES: hypothetical protein [Acinetobacter]|uniref:DUF432 domain-containing protein n=2 Tax=Acinetobacter soli TaxID=487316 RepID=A0AB38Z0F0_9GAMM|nr:MULTISPECIES: hypothetical protein [Acinetobacter]ENV56135.1 hypothetical protein F951_02765 [Acinetobacter soli CIP 110264]ENV60712.1 hypothetical protein F950_01433 [Acinetobacter soli NIPH 2899]KOR16078.1 hypothetical protein ABW55_05965 [Acinetobacter sp. C15]KQC96200.1 hypothetical protein APD01_13345 [Acinetobacter soli]MBO3673046.1 hypothetical protein [Acinetobacter soli]